MTLMTNCTPFAASHLSVFDQHATQLNVVIVSATFQSRGSAPLDVAEEQLPVRDVDIHRGEPGRSSVVCEGEVAWSKPRVDVLVNGAAYAPAGRKVTSIHATLQFGRINKTLKVSGDRLWKHSPLGRYPGSPEPFERMAIIYERAFGGFIDEPGGHADVRNLVGVGFHGARATSPDVSTEVPNIEYPDECVTSPSDAVRPAGFGALARGWQPRQGHAGTYDDAWLASRAPLLPADFDLQHFQCAPVDQQVDCLVGGERGLIRNMTPDGSWSFVLPTLVLPVHFRCMDRIEQARFAMDTVIIEPDARRVVLLGRATLPLRRNHPPLTEIIVGDVSPGWLLARRRRKPYWGRSPASGGGPKRNYKL